MKRIIIVIVSLIILALYVQPAKAQDTTSLTTKQVYTDAKAFINNVADKAGKAGTVGWQILVRQQRVQSMISLANLLFLLIVTLIFLRLFSMNVAKTTTKGHDWYEDDWEDHTLIMLPFILSIIAGLIFIICVLCMSSNIITGFTNPEYGAIKDIAEFFSPK